MKNWKQSVFLGMVAIIILVFGFVGCKPDPDPECECPAGTLHLVGETGCKSLNKCYCEHNVPGTRSYNGIAITSRAGIAIDSNSVVVANINDAIKAADGLGCSADTLKKNIKEITIVAGNEAMRDFAARTVYVGLNAPMGVIRNEFTSYFYEEGIVP
jgi:hypothetical protein